jgi:deazaflavin-dependent oxidoreductase (nitroreductase family)
MAPPNNRLLIALASKANTFWYRLTGGAIGGRFGRAPILLLTTTGRKSGKPRTTPLLYLEDGADVVIVGSNAGDARHPAWWRNLQHNPDAMIQIRRETRPVRARQATDEEKARLWPKLTAMYPDYDVYTTRTTRVLPVIILGRRQSEDVAASSMT